MMHPTRHAADGAGGLLCAAADADVVRAHGSTLRKLLTEK